MNFLFFTQLFYPFIYGGGEYIFLLITKELVKRGHNVSVISQRLPGTDDFDEVDGIKIYRVGPPIVSHGMLTPSIKNNLGYLISSLKKGRNIIANGKNKAEGIDIIHSNTYVPVFSGHFCSKFYKIPHIVTFHDVYQASNEKFWIDLAIKNNPNAAFYTPWVSKIIERIIMKLNVSAFHTVSDTSKKDLLSFGIENKKIHVIPNGLDASQYVDISVDDSKYLSSKKDSIVFVGRLISYKNIETVIKAFKKIVNLVPDAQFIIIGDGQYKNTLANEAKSLGDKVIFTGRISDPEKIKIIKSSSFMVFPSLVEGFGISIIEGFACKKPVLVSNIKPMSDIVSDDKTGYVIPSLEVDEWAKKILSLLKDKQKQKEMGENAHKTFLEHYEINEIVSSFEGLYKMISNKDS